MLNKKTISIGGASSIAVLAIFLVFTFGTPTEIPTTNELPTMVAGGFPPSKLMTKHVGSEIPEISENKVNPEYAKYKELQFVDGYQELQVYKDDKGDIDVLLGTKPLQNDMTGYDVLYSQNYIWITKEPHDEGENISIDVYKSSPLNEGYRLTEINDEIRYAPIRSMTQMVNVDREPIGIAPLDLWFVTEDYSYTIRGHITEDQAIQMANKLLAIE